MRTRRHREVKELADIHTVSGRTRNEHVGRPFGSRVGFSATLWVLLVLRLLISLAPLPDNLCLLSSASQGDERSLHLLLLPPGNSGALFPTLPSWPGVLSSPTHSLAVFCVASSTHLSGALCPSSPVVLLPGFLHSFSRLAFYLENMSMFFPSWDPSS